MRRTVYIVLFFSLFLIAKLPSAFCDDAVTVYFEGKIDRYLEEGVWYYPDLPIKIDITFDNVVTCYGEDVDYARTCFGVPTIQTDYDFKNHAIDPNQTINTTWGNTHYTEQKLSQEMEVMFRGDLETTAWSVALYLDVQGLLHDGKSGQRTPADFLTQLNNLLNNNTVFMLQAFGTGGTHRGSLKITEVISDWNLGPDTDGDGISDNVDVCPDTVVDSVDAKGCSDAQVDFDSDGICNPEALSNGPSACIGIDNCPTMANPLQTDVNNDGYGDVCVAPDSDISDNCDVGDNPIIGSGCQIDKGTSIGNDAQIGEDVEIKKDSVIADNVVIGDGTIINRNVTIGDNVIIGSYVTIGKDVIIGSDVQIGDNSIIDQSVTIEDKTVIGAGVTIEREVYINAGVVISDGSVIDKGEFVTISIKTITIDGNPADWEGISPFLVDVSGDSCDTGTDIRRVYLAKDECYLYWRMDTESGEFKHQPTNGNSYHGPGIVFYSTDNGIIQRGVEASIWSTTIDGWNMGIISERDQNTDWTQYAIHQAYGAINDVAEGKIPLGLFEGYTFNPPLVWYQSEIPGILCDETSNTNHIDITLNNDACISGGVGYINEVEPNDTLSTSQDIDSYFTLGSNPDIADSATIPYVSIKGTGDGTFDYYKFYSFGGGQYAIFDIDYGYQPGDPGSFDSFTAIWDSSGNCLYCDHGANPSVGAGGSTHGEDSYNGYNIETAGWYIIGVAKDSRYPWLINCPNDKASLNGGFRYPLTPIPLGATYELQVSVPDHSMNP
jgi:acetyltransferase-like isoleucine patch superfamily enzyme